MHPEICKLGPLTIYSYGLMLVIAFIVGSTLAKQEAKKRNINPEFIFNFLLSVFVLGIIGARIFYVAQNAGFYFKSPIEIFMLHHGGLSWFGGLISGVISGVLYLKKEKMPVLKTLDLIAPFVIMLLKRNYMPGRRSSELEELIM